MRINVRDMQRVPHVHRSAKKNVKINGRYVCDECPYRWKRPKALGTKRPMYDFEQAEMNQVFARNYDAMTVPALVELVRKREPSIKGLSKMRKADLVAALLER